MAKLEMAYDGTQSPSLTIISVPGLPIILPRYQIKDHRPWMQNILSHHFPEAQSWCFGYDFAKILTDTPCWEQIVNYALDLLHEVHDSHKTSQDWQRPLIFLCQSFGAVILKNALSIAKRRDEFRHIFERTAGIFFLACLHDERSNDFESQLLRCAVVELGLTKSQRHAAKKALKIAADWQTVRGVLEKFRELAVPCPVRTFCESKATIYRSPPMKVGRSKSSILCSQTDAFLGLAREKVICVDADHLQLTTFPGRTDPFLETLLAALHEVIDALDPPEQLAIDPPVANVTDMLLVDANQEALLTEMVAVSLSNAATADNTSDSRAAARTVRLPCRLYKPFQSNHDFTGRETVMETLAAELLPQNDNDNTRKVFALVGLGGMGKTQTALHFMFEHMHTFPAILWAPAASRAKLLERYLDFAVQLGIVPSHNYDQLEAATILMEWFATTDIKWLLLFDNLDSEDALKIFNEFCPKGNTGSILITSRDRSFATRSAGVPLEPLDPDEGIILLSNLLALPSTDDGLSDSTLAAASRLVAKIGTVPIVLRQAAQLILDSGATLSEFEEAYTLREMIVDSQDTTITAHPQQYPYNLSNVWSMSFDRLQPSHIRLLNIMSFLDIERIQTELLAHVVELLEVADDGSKFSRLHLVRAKTSLLQSSLVYQNEALGELRMHGIVQAFCHWRMTDAERQMAFTKAVSVVSAAWPVTRVDRRHDKSLWPAQQLCLTHVQSLGNLFQISEASGRPMSLDVIKVCSLLQHTAWYMYERGVIDEAYPLLDLGERILLEKGAEGSNLVLAELYNVRASLGTESNRFTQALHDFQSQRSCIEEAIREGRLTQPNLREIFSISGLGNGYAATNNHENAEACYRQAIKMYADAGYLEPLRKVSVVESNLATCLWLQGKLDEAEVLLLGLITDWNDTTSYRTAHAMFALGNVEMSQGLGLITSGDRLAGEERLRKACSTHTQCLHLLQTIYGTKHHKVGHAWYKMAQHAHCRRDYGEARQCLDIALGIFTKSPLFRNEVARNLYKVGCVLQDSGDVAAGRAKIEEADALRREILQDPYDHSDSEPDFDNLVMVWSR